MTGHDALIDDVSRHHPGDVGFEHAALPPALFLAWCVSMDQVSHSFLDTAGSVVTQLKMRDISPADAFVSTCGGELRSDVLSDAAQRFASDLYPRYLEELHPILAEQIDSTVDGWAIYEQISPWLTRRWFDQRGGSFASSEGIVARVSRWWSSR